MSLFWYSLGVPVTLLRFFSKIWPSSGKRNANVFPDPVGAIIITSFPLEKPGNEYLYTGLRLVRCNRVAFCRKVC